MITILFGAGASLGFYNTNPSTSYLTSRVKDINVWLSALARYHNKNLPSAQDIVGVINRICQYHLDYNFEQICEVLDKFCSYNFDNLPQHTYLANIVCVLSDKILRTQPVWADVPFVYRQIIADTLVELHNKQQRPDYVKWIRLQTSLLEYICQQDEQVNIVSFNYDNIVFESASQLGFINGFIPSSDPRHQQKNTTNAQVFLNAKRVVYFPHGHIRFRLINSGDVLFYDNINEANFDRWNKYDTSTIGITLTGQYTQFAYNYNTFLTTGQTKDNSFNIAPYSYYYQRLATDILNSDKIILIGYSFGDEHVNRLLQSFVIRNNNNVVYIVDYYSVATSPISLIEEMSDQRNILMKINQTFKAPWIISYNPLTSAKTPINPKAVADLNNNSVGYGEIFPNITYYRKGYHAFLQEYQNIL